MSESLGSSAIDPGRRPSAAVLAVADGIALVAFVAAGLRSHGIEAMAEIAARNLVPLAVVWVAVSVVLGTYRRRDLASLVMTWAISVPSALLVRTWWVGSPRGGRIAVFLGVGLAFTLLFLLVGRLVVAVVTRTRPVWRERGERSAGASRGQ
jgi:hypothetical protein